MGNKNVTVSVNMITYMHELYIKEAIEGVLMQKTDFNFELIIADDCSPDRTPEIIENIIKTHPQGHKIKYFRHEKNIGMQANGVFAYNQCDGKYIALCEGDDYWTDPLKLQKQVNFLEKNIEYVLCFHEINILKTDGQIVDDFITKVPENYETIEDLAESGNCIHTPSVVFRNIIEEFSFEFQLSPIGDYFLYIMLAEYGKIKCLNEKMAIYRFESGFYSKLTYSQKFKKWNRTLLLILSYCKNDKVKSIMLKTLFDSLKLNDDVESKQKINSSTKKRFIKIVKLLIPPIFLLIKRKISSLRYVSK
ncbi:glycosyltransferase [Flavobacterium sp. KMS]|uniref:glycosyltransferase family 2 protein n=1 Tax=unclassified Flavobacterium TaxID=196869 RepID=UPI00068B7F45|nr:glycosyltransferase [Flavobacterium sp. KMS]